MQLPIQIVVDALPPPASTPGAATASRPPSAVFEMKLANAGRRTDRTYTDQDDTAAANLFASQFRDQLRDASRSGVGACSAWARRGRGPLGPGAAWGARARPCPSQGCQWRHPSTP